MPTPALRPALALWLLGFAVLALAVPKAGAQDDPPPPPAPARTALSDEPEPPRPDLLPFELPPVIVTGTLIRLREDVPRTSIESVGSRDVFGPDQVKETGARSLNSLVHYLPGASTRPYNGGEAAAPSFSMRGLPDDGLTEYVHVLVDGVPASPLPYGWTAFSFFPLMPDQIHAVDLHRGAHSVRYSPNTVGGVMNFLTPPIPGCPEAGAMGVFGTQGYRAARAWAGGTAGPWGVRVEGGWREGDGYRDNGGFSQQAWRLRVRREVGARAWVALAASTIESEHQAPGGIARAEFDTDRFANARPENRFAGENQVVDLVAHLDTGPRSWVEGFAWWSHTRRHLRAQRPHFGVPATMADWRDDAYGLAGGARAQQVLCLGGIEHVLYGGVRFYREWIPHWRLGSEPFPGGPRTPTQDARYETNAVSVHLDDTFELLPCLTANLGARFEWIPRTEGEDDVGGWAFDTDFVRVLPGAGLSWEFAPRWALYGNYFEGFRTPQVWGYASVAPGGDLDFEVGRSAELGVRCIDWRGWNASLTGWRTEYDDFGVFYSGFYENLGRILAYGADLVLDYDASWIHPRLCGLSFHASLTLQDSVLERGPNKGNQTPYAWEQKAAWRVRYERAGWVASLGGTYVGESFSDDANTRTENANGNLGVNPAVTLWDARLSHERRLDRHVTVEGAVGVTNLFDREWHVHSRGGFFGPGLVAGPPRQGYVSLAVTMDL